MRAEVGDGKTTFPAYRSPAAWVRLLLVLAIGLACDLGSKAWAFRTVADEPIVLDRSAKLADPGNYRPIPPHPGKPILPWNLMELHLVRNPGAVFGIGANQRAFFISFTLVALAAGLLVFGRFTTNRSRLGHLALGLILAGGVGNLYDRIRFADVRDFLHMLPDRKLPFGWTWPGDNPEIFPWVFNVADVMLLSGMILLMLHINGVEKQRRLEAEAAGKAESGKPKAEGPEPTAEG
jgi:signal peptidase II